MDLTILSNLIITSSLLVLIWMIQLNHYPIFRYIDAEDFPRAMSFHQNSISLVVIPLMIIELGTVTYLSLSGNLEALAQLFLVSIIWMSTFFIQVPIHRRLIVRKDSRDIEKLICSNWIRTIAWTLKAMIAIRSTLLI